MKKQVILWFCLLLTLAVNCAAAESQEPSLYVLNERYAIDYYINPEGFVEMSILRCTVDLDQRTEEMTNEELHVVIPSELDGYPVTNIDAFFHFQSTHGVLPAKVVSITIPDSVQTIAEPVFMFRGLSEIIVSTDNPIYESVNGVLFNKLNHSLLCYPAARADVSYSAPEGTLSITDYAFTNCANLKTLTLPDSLTTVCTNAFAGQCGLEVLNIGSSFSGFIWQNTGRSANTSFDFAPSLREIHVSAQNPTYRSVDGTLYSADGSTLLCYPQGREEAHFALPESVTFIDAHAFDGRKIPLAIALPDSFCFEDGEPRSVHIYPIAITDERMQHFLNAATLSRSTQRKIQSSYELYEPGTKASQALLEAFPALQNTALWIERNAARSKSLSESNQEKLAQYFAEAGYTLTDLNIDDASHTLSRSFYPYTVVCPQLSQITLPEIISLAVKPDSLAYHWAVQNSVPTVIVE